MVVDEDVNLRLFPFGFGNSTIFPSSSLAICGRDTVVLLGKIPKNITVSLP